MKKIIKIILSSIAGVSLLAVISVFILPSFNGNDLSNYNMSDVSLNDSSFTYTGNPHSITIDGTLPEGVNVFYSGNGKINAGEYDVTAEFTGDYVTYNRISDMDATMTIVKSSIPGISLVGNSYTYDGAQKSIEIDGTLPEGVYVTYENNNEITAGSYMVTASFNDTTGNYENLPDLTATLTINKAEFDMSEVSFNDSTYTYDGTEKYIKIGGTLPEGIEVTYENNVLTNVGSSEATAVFSHNNPNYKDIPSLIANLTIISSSIEGVNFTGSIYTYDGSVHSVVVTGDLPTGVNVTYTNNDQTQAGTYVVVAHFEDTTGNFTVPADMNATLTISKSPIEGFDFRGSTCIYDGDSHSIAIAGVLPTGVNVTYTNNDQTQAGTYVVVAHLEDTTGNFTVPADMNATLTINQADYNMTGISFDDATYIYDGNPKTFEITGTLPDGVNVAYTTNTLTEVGSIEVIAIFSGNSNYKTITNMSATFNIKLNIPDASYINGTISWNQVYGANYYYVNINDIDYQTTDLYYEIPDDIISNEIIFTLQAAMETADINNPYSLSDVSTSTTLTRLQITNIRVEDGTLVWDAVDDAQSYVLHIENTNISVVDTFYAFSDEDYDEFDVTITAICKEDTTTKLNSNISESIHLQTISNAINLTVEDGIISWDKVDEANGYEVMISGQIHFVGQSDNPSYDLGSYDLADLECVTIVGNDTNLISNIWDHFTVKIYENGIFSETKIVYPGQTITNEAYANYYFDEEMNNRISNNYLVKFNLTLYFENTLYVENGITYLEYGSYPQTVVLDEDIISNLNNITEIDSDGYYSYNDIEYAKLVATPYRSYCIFNDDNTTIIEGTTYYFEVEPILWRVLSETDGTYKLLAENILDNQEYDDLSSDYEDSEIRAWLNDDFYNHAFTDNTWIQNTLVDNSSESTGHKTNAYTCEDTNDNIYLLSYADITNEDYGFDLQEEYYFFSSKSCSRGSDYTRAKGCFMRNRDLYYYEFGRWWLRSPDYTTSILAQIVSYNGKAVSMEVDISSNGVRPALTIMK